MAVSGTPDGEDAVDRIRPAADGQKMSTWSTSWLLTWMRTPARPATVTAWVWIWLTSVAVAAPAVNASASMDGVSDGAEYSSRLTPVLSEAGNWAPAKWRSEMPAACSEPRDAATQKRPLLTSDGVAWARVVGRRDSSAG